MSKEDLTPLTSKRAAEIGAMGGRAKKGSKHLSTLIRKTISNIDWDKTNLKNKEELRKKYGNNGWVALVYVAQTQAMAGDAKARDWLSKNGYGTKIDITTDGEKLNKIVVEFVDGKANTDTDRV